MEASLYHNTELLVCWLHKSFPGGRFSLSNQAAEQI